MIVEMTEKEGVILATKDTLCDEDIEVVPTFEMNEGNAFAEYVQGTKTEITAEDLAGVTDITFSSAKITSVSIPDTVKTIASGTFLHWNSLKKVYITDIAKWCEITFSNDWANPLCNGIDLYLNNKLVEDLIIPDGVKNIKNNSFIGCQSLKTLTMPNSVTTLGDNVFSSCRNLSTVNLSSGITYLNPRAFNGCQSLISIVIPNSVTGTAEYVFSNCTGLTKVTIGRGMRTLGYAVFGGCTNLMEIVCLAETPPTLNASLNGVPETCIIKVLPASVETYKSATNWSARADYIIALTPEEVLQYGG